MIARKTPKNGDDPPAGGDDEMVFDETDTTDEVELEDIEGDFKDELKKVKGKLAACQKERQEYLDGWQRAKADYLNSQRRAAEERERETERQTARFIERILPLVDSFDRAITDMKKETGGEGWRAGVEQIYNQLAAVLKSYNVELLEPKGERFDPHLHEAISEMPVTEAAQDHTVLEVLQKGYRMGERLIRPAKVVVGSFVSDTKK